MSPTVKSMSSSEKTEMKKGDLVRVTVQPHQNNGDSEAIGFVVKVLDAKGSDDSDLRVNVKVITDSDTNLLLRNVPVVSQQDFEESEDSDSSSQDDGDGEASDQQSSEKKKVPNKRATKL